MNISSGMYAVFKIKQDFSLIPLMYQYIYFEWLPKSSYEFRSEMILEHYDDAFDFVNETGSMSILIPVRKV